MERIATADRKRKARHALNALVCRRNQEIDSAILEVKRDSTKSAHRIDEVHLLMVLDDLTNFFNRIDDASRRLAVHDGDVGDRWVLGQRPVEICQLWKRVFRGLQREAVSIFNIRAILAIRSP
jgi:Sec7-like guanine-nucleotide exchange factor